MLKFDAGVIKYLNEHVAVGGIQKYTVGNVLQYES